MYLFGETARNIVEFHSNNHTWVTRGLTHKHMAREVHITKQLKRVLDVVIGMFYTSIRNGMLNDHIHLLDKDSSKCSHCYQEPPPNSPVLSLHKGVLSFFT